MPERIYRALFDTYRFAVDAILKQRANSDSDANAPAEGDMQSHILTLVTSLLGFRLDDDDLFGGQNVDRHYVNDSFPFYSSKLLVPLSNPNTLTIRLNYKGFLSSAEWEAMQEGQDNPTNRWLTPNYDFLTQEAYKKMYPDEKFDYDPISKESVFYHEYEVDLKNPCKSCEHLSTAGMCLLPFNDKPCLVLEEDYQQDCKVQWKLKLRPKVGGTEFATETRTITVKGTPYKVQAIYYHKEKKWRLAYADWDVHRSPLELKATLKGEGFKRFETVLRLLNE